MYYFTYKYHYANHVIFTSSSHKLHLIKKFISNNFIFKQNHLFMDFYNIIL